MWDRVDTSLQFGRLVNGVLVCLMAMYNATRQTYTVKLEIFTGEYYKLCG